jgi:hypothetical protein
MRGGDNVEACLRQRIQLSLASGFDLVEVRTNLGRGGMPHVRWIGQRERGARSTGVQSHAQSLVKVALAR